MAGSLQSAHLANEIGTAGEAGPPIPSRLSLLVPNCQELFGHTMHKLGGLSGQGLHSVRQLDHLQVIKVTIVLC